MIRIATLLGILVACISADARAVEIRRWERVPLSVPLVIGQERVIFVDRNVRVAVPMSIGESLSVQSAGGAVYLRASAPLDRTRLQLQDADTGTLILLDVTATAAEPALPPLEPIRIVDGGPSSSSEEGSNATRTTRRSGLAGTLSDSGATPIPVVLTRYAAQCLYAPLRTVEPIEGVAQVSTRGITTLDSLLPSLPVRARPLAAWRLGDHWVTALELSNTSQHNVDLDPRALAGDFVAATFQHRELGPAGDPTDTSVLYLVTHGHGLRDAVLPAISAFDASKNLGSGEQNETQP